MFLFNGNSISECEESIVLQNSLQIPNHLTQQMSSTDFFPKTSESQMTVVIAIINMTFFLSAWGLKRTGDFRTTRLCKVSSNFKFWKKTLWKTFIFPLTVIWQIAGWFRYAQKVLRRTYFFSFSVNKINITKQNNLILLMCPLHCIPLLKYITFSIEYCHFF